MIPTEIDLSEREREILRLVATGASNKQIAQDLFISTNTVKVHLRNIFAKIGVTSRTEATLYAIREGLVPTPGGGGILSSISSLASSSEPSIINDEIPKHRLSKRVRFGMMAGAVIIVLGMIGLIIRPTFLFPSSPTQASSSQPHWQTLAPLPMARSGLAAAVYDDQIVAIGGEGISGVTGEVDLYTPADNKWQTLGSKTTAVTDVSAVTVGGKIYVPGGRLQSGEPTDLLEVYDPLSHQWTEESKIPIRVSGYSLSMLDGKIYLFGGWDGTNILNSVYEYNPDLDAWTKRTPMPTRRKFASVAIVNSNIYVIGGTGVNGPLKTNEMYSPAREAENDNPWKEKAPLPVSYSGVPAIGLVDSVFIISFNGKSDYTPISYSVEKNEWQNSKTPNDGWSGSAMVLYQSYIFILGGKSKDGYSAMNTSYKAIYTISLPVYKYSQ